MRIVTLVENTCPNNKYIAEHGLCIYVETEKHKLLVDSGQTNAVINNADALGIDLSLVDTLILSHGHYDHSGGILPFRKRNNTAKIYMQKTAADPHFNGERYIGIDPDILSLPDLITLDGNHTIDDELFLFSNITGRKCYPQGNKKLLCEKNGTKVPDDFSHEQCLVISQNGNHYLLSGCAHNGIINILDRYYELFGDYPNYVISGFHMMKRDGIYSQKELNTIMQTAHLLSDMNTVFFSGHCTGTVPFEIMKQIMGDKLCALHSGYSINI